MVELGPQPAWPQAICLLETGECFANTACQWDQTIKTLENKSQTGEYFCFLFEARAVVGLQLHVLGTQKKQIVLFLVTLE